MYNSSTMDYFKHPDRIGETTDFVDVLKVVFENIYNNEDRKKLPNLKHYSSIENHPFFQIVIEQYNSPKVLEGEQSKCNIVFADYLCKLSKLTRRHVLLKFVTYVTLFRECLNYFNLNKKNGDKTNVFYIRVFFYEYISLITILLV